MITLDELIDLEDDDPISVTNMDSSRYAEKESSKPWIEMYYKCIFGKYPDENVKFSCRNIYCPNHNVQKSLSDLHGSHVESYDATKYMTALCPKCNNYHNEAPMLVEIEDLIPLEVVELEDEFEASIENN